jgi:hypothetical protein
MENDKFIAKARSEPKKGRDGVIYQKVPKTRSKRAPCTPPKPRTDPLDEWNSYRKRLAWLVQKVEAPETVFGRNEWDRVRMLLGIGQATAIEGTNAEETTGKRRPVGFDDERQEKRVRVY